MDEQQEKKLRKIIGLNARMARMREGMTQEEVAERLGISPEVYGRIERGLIFPRVPTLVDLCKALRRPSDDLLGLVTNGHLSQEGAQRTADNSPEFRRLLARLRRLSSSEQRALLRLLVAFER